MTVSKVVVPVVLLSIHLHDRGSFIPVLVVHVSPGITADLLDNADTCIPVPEACAFP